MKTNTAFCSHLHLAVPVLTLMLLTLPAVVQAQFTYTVSNGTITITGYTGPSGAVTIPDIIGDLPVTAIGNSAFEGQTSMTSVAIPSSVTSIRGSAFGGCTSLTSVAIPTSVTSIGSLAFAFCTNLISITIPDGVTDIGDRPFDTCTSLTSITVGAANTNYSSSNGVLFNKLQTTLIECPAGKAGIYAIPGSVTSIGDYAFYYCASLTSITIPEGVSSLGAYTFEFCTSLISIKIPASLTNIGWRSFYNTSLIAITVDAANTVYSSLNGVVFNKSQTALIRFPGGRGGSYAIPTSVTSIWDDAFHDCPKLTSVTIPDGVTSIGFAAFWGCPKLTSVTIPGGIESISGYAFSYCRSLTNVTIPGSVTYVGQGAFLGCTSLTRVTIPGSVYQIGFGAFIDCTSLKGIFFQGNAPSFSPFDGSYMFDGATNVIIYYLPGTTGWGPTFADRPAVLWNPLMQTSGPAFGVGPAGFGFNITGTTNIPIVVEATTNLAHGPWVPLKSLSLTNGAFYFSDPNWTNFPARNYRIRSP